MLKNAKDTDTIELKFINGGKDIAKYTHTPGTGERYTMNLAEE